MRPIDRATLEWAFRVTVGYSAEDEVYTTRDMSIITAHDRVVLDPSNNPSDALLVALAQAMKLHIDGLNFGQLRSDLVAAGLREESANCVHDHLVDVSVGEWDRLKARIRWYREDKCDPIAVSTTVQGNT